MEASSLLSADGRYEIRLTRDPADIAASQRLRYRVFYEEMSAVPTPAMAREHRDMDRFDEICEHLLVIDRTRAADDAVVGTYRMLRHEVALAHGGHYTADEYDITPLIASLGSHKACEIGRSCVHRDYRNNATIQLLWRGLAKYYADNNITRVFGCASLAGTDISRIALPLSYLYQEHTAPAECRVRALPERYQSMNLIPRDQIDVRQALREMPPLIRAYIRLGGWIGDGAVIDSQFSTTDVFVILYMENVPEKYHAHYERDGALVIG